MAIGARGAALHMNGSPPKPMLGPGLLVSPPFPLLTGWINGLFQLICVYNSTVLRTSYEVNPLDMNTNYSFP